MSVRAAAIAAALLAACGSAPPGPRPQLDHALLAAVDAADFPGAPALLAGFDAPATDAAFRVGDSVLFALAVHDGERVERRLLRLRVAKVAPTLRGVLRGGAAYSVRPSATTIAVTLTKDGIATEHRIVVTPLTVELAQFAADGTPVRASTVTLYEEPLRTGLRALVDAGDAELVRAVVLIESLQQLGVGDPVLAEQLFAIADRPSLWSVVWHAGVHVSLNGNAIAPWRGLVTDDGAGERAVLPLDVAVNGANSLWSDVLVAEAQPPFALCAGVLGAIARHATDPQRYCVLRLLAARRGPVPPDAPAKGPAAQ